MISAMMFLNKFKIKAFKLGIKVGAVFQVFVLLCRCEYLFKIL